MIFRITCLSLLMQTSFAVMSLRRYQDKYECYTGSNYTGTKSVTVTGIPCQEWNATLPHFHFFTKPHFFHVQSMDEVSNYCRDPDGKGYPWCYTTKFEYISMDCGIRRCSDEMFARSCADLKLFGGIQVDGNYVIYPKGLGTQPVWFYCYGMRDNTPPTEFITLQYDNVAIYVDVSGRYCDPPYQNAKTIVFTKLRVDVETMEVLRYDFTFARRSHYRFNPYGRIENCYMKAMTGTCKVNGVMLLDTRGTHLKFDPSIDWHPMSTKSTVYSHTILYNGLRHEVKCIWDCGGCKPDKNMKLVFVPDKGGWAAWSTPSILSSCSVTCGWGMKEMYQMRYCKHTKLPCLGPKVKYATEFCKATNPCKIRPQWNNWVEIQGHCSASCGVGEQWVLRKRKCSVPQPKHAQDGCNGSNSETKLQICYPKKSCRG